MPHILIIEDDTDLTLLIQHVLEPLHCRLSIASNGIEGLQCLEAAWPDLVILDLHLPYISGEDILRAIHADGNLRQPFIIVFSVYGDRPLPYPVDLILEKPAGINQMRQQVRELLSARQA